MKGKIKWFSEKKGYGFITGHDNEDRYLHVTALVGRGLPRMGDEVIFEEAEGRTGEKPRAINVKITLKASNAQDRFNKRDEGGFFKRVWRAVLNMITFSKSK